MAEAAKKKDPDKKGKDVPSRIGRILKRKRKEEDDEQIDNIYKHSETIAKATELEKEAKKSRIDGLHKWIVFIYHACRMLCFYSDVRNTSRARD